MLFLLQFLGIWMVLLRHTACADIPNGHICPRGQQLLELQKSHAQTWLLEVALLSEVCDHAIYFSVFEVHLPEVC